MFVYTSYKESVGETPHCIALGNFDGVHLGHIKLIEKTISKAKELGCKGMIYTFLQHPRKMLFPNFPSERITNDKSRLILFERYGIDCTYLEDFNRIKNMDPETFISKILIKRFNVKCVVAGYNFKFGFKQSGNIKVLKKLGEKYGFDVLIIKPVIINGNIVSSSLIRDLIRYGEVEKAKPYLGRYFSLKGVVVHGRKFGSKIGIRTANIAIENEMILPKNGVYLTNTIVQGYTYKSVTNIGYNPTFKCKKISLETHIIDFNDHIYDSEVEVEFIKWQREEKCFASIDELKQQINYDIRCRLD